MDYTKSSMYCYFPGGVGYKTPGAIMELIWLVLSLLVVDLAAMLFAADTRPGLQHGPRWWNRRSLSG
jgi:hypothetical protein